MFAETLKSVLLWAVAAEFIPRLSKFVSRGASKHAPGGEGASESLQDTQGAEELGIPLR